MCLTEVTEDIRETEEVAQVEIQKKWRIFSVLYCRQCFGCFTLALWLNLLSSHFMTAAGPPNGKIGRSWRSKEHRSCNLLQIWETAFRLKFSVSAILLWGSSCVNEKITRSIVPSGILGNSANKLFVRRLLLFWHPVHLLYKKKERKNKWRLNRKELRKRHLWRFIMQSKETISLHYSQNFHIFFL